MTLRAVIVAVEDYPNSEGLATKLEGTVANGNAVRDWLLQKKGATDANIAFLSNPDRKQIADTFRDLVDSGKDNTEELYVFFSGHGFTFNDSPFKQKPADVVVGSEFQNLQDSGDACLRLNDIQLALWRCLGPGTHYYFIDACRNLVAAGKVTPGTLGWSREDSNLGQPRLFTLFSTERGSAAALSGFAPALVDGISGKGRAKAREGFEMFVTFDSLSRYLETILDQKIQPEPGGGVGRILQIDPIPIYRCGVQVKNSRAGDVFVLVVHNALRQQIYGPQSFNGDHAEFAEGPDDYYVQVTHPQCAVVPASPVKADLYEDCSLSFERLDQPPTLSIPAASALPPAEVTLLVPPDNQLLIRNIRTGKMTEAQNSFSGELDPGEYDVRVNERSWTSVRKLRFGVNPGQTLSLNAGSRTRTPVTDSLLAAIPGAHDTERADFSETLGPMANQDLGLWLSLIGASRIVSKMGGDFSKLDPLPLATFDNVQPGDSPTYALLGLESLPSSINLAVHRPNEEPQWNTLEQVSGLQGVFEYQTACPPGLNLVSVRLPDKAPLTVVAYNLPNRATLFVVADDDVNGLRIHQFALPIAKLEKNLTPVEQTSQPQHRLEAVRFMTLAQRQMARKRPMKPDQATASPQEQNLWTDLLYGKWLDPIMAIMAAYELVRTNSLSMMQGEFGAIVLNNLRQYFSALPDVEVIAKMAKVPFQEPKRPPLFLVGLMALNDYEKHLPLPAAHLDMAGPWITWLSAVALSKASGSAAD